MTGTIKYQIEGINDMFQKAKNTVYQTSSGAENAKPWTVGRAEEMTEIKSEIGLLQIYESFWLDILKTIKFY